MKMRPEDLLIHKLRVYGNSDIYPFHMPGHKRSEMEAFWNPFELDITEIEGFDNLHHPEGILKESMEWAADIYGADRTSYLVNGSSSGILSAICGCVTRGGRILISRNCHKAVYHGVFLWQLQAAYVYPQEIPALGIQGGILPEDVEKLLTRYMDTQAVLIVSPTYDGVVSDIRGIAEAVHKAGLPLIVDEAHGAHFRFEESLPVSALDLGADVVIQSVHKTLPSLTQTALIHVKCNRPGGDSYVDMERIDRYLPVYQSSSPSYVLMASIENSIFLMDRTDMEPFMKELGQLRIRLGEMESLELVTEALKGQYGIFDLDQTKVVVSTRKAGVSGTWLKDKLRETYRLEMEMCGPDYVTAITTVMDRKEGLRRLSDALLEIDERLSRSGQSNDVSSIPDSEIRKSTDSGGCIYSRANDVAMTISDAMDGKQKEVLLRESVGFISGEFVYIYPPGIPILAPGEWISRRNLDLILSYIGKKLPVQGLADRSLTSIKVVDRG